MRSGRVARLALLFAGALLAGCRGKRQPTELEIPAPSPPPSSSIPVDRALPDELAEGSDSYDVMGTFPEQVYGKTGTAQYTGQPDYAWYVCFVPDWATNRPILVAVHVEKGGFGAVGAAPVARQILNQWFFGNRGKYVAGSSHTL